MTRCRMPNDEYRIRQAVVLGVLLACATVALGQGYRLPWNCISSGGSPGTSTSFGTNGSAAQPAQGTGASSTYKGYWGFWHGFAPEEVPEIDVGVKAITSPPSYVEVNTEITPRVTVKNYSSTGVASFTVCFKLRKPTGEWVHECEQPVVGLEPLGEEEVEFASYNVGTDEGNWRAYCSTYAAGDPNPENNVWVKTFRVSSLPTWPYGWHEVKSMPAPPSGKPVKDGGWLALHQGAADDGAVYYVAKGYKTADFFRYYPVVDSWARCKDIPDMEGTRSRLPSKGCVGVSDGEGFVYMTKGNNTLGFWRYNTATDQWDPMPEVPLGAQNKKVKGGTDMVYAVREDTGYVYLLKGYKTEFYRFNTMTQTWDLPLPEVPYGGGKQKYDKGSFLVYDGGSSIYAHQAKYYDKAASVRYHYMFRYDLGAGRWTDTLKGMPLLGWHGGKPGKNKKSKDGAAGDWYDDNIFALKGGNTQQFFRYFPDRDSWAELDDTLPAYGSTGKKKYVKQGGDFAGYAGGVFFALKGNKTREVWRYKLEPEFSRPGRSGVMAGNVEVRTSKFELFPNPVASGFVTIRLSLPKAGPVAVTVFDIAGRSVLRQSAICILQSAMTLDARRLAAGVYLLRLDAEGYSTARKLVVQR